MSDSDRIVAALRPPGLFLTRLSSRQPSDAKRVLFPLFDADGFSLVSIGHALTVVNVLRAVD